MCKCIIKHNAVHKFDPTKTTTIRNAWVKEANRRFRVIKREIIQRIVTEDHYEFKKHTKLQLKTNYHFPNDGAKMKDFSTWLSGRTDDILLDANSNPLAPSMWQDGYIESGYKKGVTRAIESKYDTSIGELTNQALMAPVHANRVNLLYVRAFDQLRGVTNEMSKQMSNVMSEGLINGYGAEKMARALNDRVEKIGMTRARVIARTETIRAHAEGTLTQYEELGVEEVVPEVEWSTAGDDRVCVECSTLEGSKYKVTDAHGIIPLHPNCRCAWLPVITPSKSASPLQRFP